MSRARAGIGIAGGALLVLSSGAHSILGWKQLSGELAAAHVDPQLVFGLQAGWQFGGVAMLVFGILTTALFTRRFRGEPVPAFPALLIGGAYLAFGVWVEIASNFEPFFIFTFLLPAALLLTGATDRT